VVDSVGEIVELKNTLSLPPYLLAMCLYIDYENTKSGRCYLWSLASFLVAMLCKITAAPFPLVILLYVWWKRGRIGWSDVKSSLPFFAVSLALGMTTVWSRSRRANHLLLFFPMLSPHQSRADLSQVDGRSFPFTPIHPLAGFRSGRRLALDETPHLGKARLVWVGIFPRRPDPVPWL
jgi:hypothetical protein